MFRLAERITPSTVLYEEDFSKVAVGYPMDRSNVNDGFKRYMGLTGADITSNYSTALLAPNLATDHNDGILMRCMSSKSAWGGAGCSQRGISPEELSSHVLSYMREAAENYLRDKPISGVSNSSRIHRAVIGVPANFTRAQKQATLRAAEKAGLTDVRAAVCMQTRRAMMCDCY
jgi:molecular chaperone DnaK (HSP70)